MPKQLDLSDKDIKELLDDASMKTTTDDDLVVLCVYDKKSQRHEINHLLLSRGMDVNTPVPNLGYLAFNSKGIVAAGFLRDMGQGTAIFDSLITNSTTPAGERNKILNMLVQKLLAVAKLMKFKQIIAFTKDKNTLLRAQAHSFEVLPHTVIALNLSGD